MTNRSLDSSANGERANQRAAPGAVVTTSPASATAATTRAPDHLMPRRAGVTDHDHRLDRGNSFDNFIA